MSLFSRDTSSGPEFDEYDQFVPGHLPDPGPHLAEFEVLTDDAHVKVHQTVRDVFEARGVYDTTFGYNLAKLNLDPRHAEAGFRYAVEDGDVLHVEFTPTTAFCPQGEVLTTAANRALNGLTDEHAFDQVVVRITNHQDSDAINEGLAADARDDLRNEDGVNADPF
ncbi:MAG: hypothetical protein ABEI98_02080 [Halorhabdus sp.]